MSPCRVWRIACWNCARAGCTHDSDPACSQPAASAAPPGATGAGAHRPHARSGHDGGGGRRHGELAARFRAFPAGGQRRRHPSDHGRFAPLVAGYVTVGERTLQLIGIDPFAAAQLAGGRPVAAAPDPATEDVDGLRRWFTEPGAVVMSAATAAALGLAINGRFDLAVGGVRQRATLVGRTADAGPGFETV